MKTPYASIFQDLTVRAQWTKEALQEAEIELSIACSTNNVNRILEISLAVNLLKNDYIEVLEKLMQGIIKNN